MLGRSQGLGVIFASSCRPRLHTVHSAYQQQVSCSARAFSLPSLREELRADLNKVCVSSKRCLLSSDRRSVLLNANASGISRTPAVGPALLAHTGSGLADTVNHNPACATAHTGLRDHAVGLISWREWHCLCGGSERQAEQSEHNRFDHCFLPVVQNGFCAVC
jgi:hypothetical protein